MSSEKPTDSAELAHAVSYMRSFAARMAEDCTTGCVEAGLLPLLEEQEVVVGAVLFAHLLTISGITAEDLAKISDSELTIDKDKET